jgi:hypothetical protein
MNMGVRPRIKLVGKNFWGSFTTLDTSSEDAYRIINEEMPEAQRPEYEKVVVNDVSEADLQTVVAQFYLRFLSLSDWIEEMGNPEVNDRRTVASSDTWFIKTGNNTWSVKLYNNEDNEYNLYHKPIIDQPLNNLMVHLNASQASDLQQLNSEHRSEGTFTISNTAWFFGTDRNAYVYNSFGNPQELDIEDFTPSFVKLSTTDYPYRISGNMALVRAANMETFRYLSRYYWVTESSGLYMDNSGTHHNYYVNPNASGYAYVPNDNLVQQTSPGLQRKALNDSG